MTVHGGDVWQVAEDMAIPVSELLDFSASINPHGLPPCARRRLALDASDVLLLSHYPDPSARRLRGALSDQLGVPRNCIAVGEGAEALLGAAVRAVRARRCLAPVPAFSEYRRICASAGVDFDPFPLDPAAEFRLPVDRFCRHLKDGRPDIVILNNPHNPSGALLKANEARQIVDAAESVGATLLLDEAFIDYAPHATLTSDAPHRPTLIIVRSLTKFYGCPALRVGYAIGCPGIAQRVGASLPTWPVTQLALDALTEAVADHGYAEEARRENEAERERLGAAMRQFGMFVFPSAANFLFVRLGPGMPSAAELRVRLLWEHRILIRNCDSYESLAAGRYVRVAVRSAEENCRLLDALGQTLKLK